MIPKHHITISIILSGILYTCFRSWGLAIGSLVAGIFIDVDHIIDYTIENGLNFNIKNFFSFFYEKKFSKIFLIFHGWELLLVLIVLAKLTDWNYWATGALIGYGQHIVLDQIINSVGFWGYFLLWRWKNRFEGEVIFPKR